MRVLLLAALLAAPSISAAQYSWIEPGTRVRVWLPEPFQQMEGPARRQLLRGTVVSNQGGVLRLSIPGTTGELAIPVGTVRKLDVSRGVSRPLSMIERAIGGAVGGATTFALMNDPRRRGGPHYRTDWRAAGVGASWGAGIGAVIGLVFPHEHWARARRRR